MSSFNKLYLARLGAVVVAILIFAVILAYHEAVSDHLVDQTAQFLSDSYKQMDGVANR